METTETATETVTTAAPAWGLKPPEGIPGAIWGARAIFSRRLIEVHFNRVVKGRTKRYIKTVDEVEISLLWDRQQMVAGNEKERNALTKWINGKGMKLLKRDITASGLSPEEDHCVVIVDGGFKLAANPLASCGYLYIVAYAV